MKSAAELRERRAFECRLTPDRALRSLDEADAFLRDRGMLTRTTDSALPSLYEACHEEAYKPGGVGFASLARDQVAMVRRAHHARPPLRRGAPR